MTKSLEVLMMDLIVGGCRWKWKQPSVGDIGNDVLKGGENSGANYFDCGDGFDTIVDFNLRSLKCCKTYHEYA
jgi:hypothetical protein